MRSAECRTLIDGLVVMTEKKYISVWTVSAAEGMALLELRWKPKTKERNEKKEKKMDVENNLMAGPTSKYADENMIIDNRQSRGIGTLFGIGAVL